MSQFLIASHQFVPIKRTVDNFGLNNAVVQDCGPFDEFLGPKQKIEQLLLWNIKGIKT